MRILPRAFLVGSLACALAATFVRCPPEPAHPPLPPVGDAEARARATGYLDIVPMRWQAKDVIAHEVIAGRRSLLQAASLFGELDRLAPERVYPVRADNADESLGIPVRNQAERLCRYVIAHVRTELRHETPARAEAVLARLAAEFFAEREAHGAIRLPDPATLEPVHQLLERAWRELPEERRRAVLARHRAGD
jgi:hypothetical protein